jgi:hypothetical protein
MAASVWMNLSVDAQSRAGGADDSHGHGLTHTEDRRWPDHVSTWMWSESPTQSGLILGVGLELQPGRFGVCPNVMPVQCASRQRHRDLVGAFDYVVVGQDVAVPAHDNPEPRLVACWASSCFGTSPKKRRSGESPGMRGRRLRNCLLVKTLTTEGVAFLAAGAKLIGPPVPAGAVAVGIGGDGGGASVPGDRNRPGANSAIAGQ